MIGEKANLRIVIYGAGAIGGVVGGLLALSGTPVLLIGRPSNVNTILEHGRFGSLLVVFLDTSTESVIVK